MDYSYVRDVFKFEDAAYASLGGIVLGICTSLHYMGYGKLTGISGMVENVISPKSENIQVVFLCGCYAVGFLYILASGKPLETLPMPSYILIIAGFCVGFGSRLGCGCTSGHGICGLARISKRSIIGVAAFMTTGVLTANLVYGPVAGGPETDLNSNWFVSNNYGGAVLLVVSFLVAMREFTLESLHYWVFGGLFGLGLSISGMVNNHIVIAFLNFNKDWDPALMFVLCFAVGVFGVTYWCSV